MAYDIFALMVILVTNIRHHIKHSKTGVNIHNTANYQTGLTLIRPVSDCFVAEFLQCELGSLLRNHDCIAILSNNICKSGIQNVLFLIHGHILMERLFVQIVSIRLFEKNRRKL